MYSENDQEETIEDQIYHELSLCLDIDTIAFFGVVMTKKSLLIEYDTSGNIPMPVIDGLRSDEIIPTMIEIDDGLSDSDRERFARSIIELGRMILRRKKT